MEYFHSKGYVLRDFKADNILIKRYIDKVQCKLIDFGMCGNAGKNNSLGHYIKNDYRDPELFKIL